MHSTSLSDLAGHHLQRAATTNAGRSAHTVYGGQTHRLRQTLIALVAGRRLGEHESPGEATLQVLRGRVCLHANNATWSGNEGDVLVIPPARHDLEALTDSVVLLTVVVDPHG